VVMDTDTGEVGGVEGGHLGPHLVCVVEAVIHEPCDQRRLPNCKTRRDVFSHKISMVRFF
jgi:hypothetical protein